MHVDVVDLLPAVAVAVHDEAITIFGDARLAGQLAGHGEHPAKSQLMLGFHVVDGGDQGIGDDQNMGLGLGLNIPECGDQIVLIQDVSRDLFTDDFAENGFLRHG